MGRDQIELSILYYLSKRNPENVRKILVRPPEYSSNGHSSTEPILCIVGHNGRCNIAATVWLYNATYR